MVIALDNPWIEVKDGDDRARGIFDRHYSRHHYVDGRKPRVFVGPGYKMVLLTQDCKALWVWRKFIDKSGQQGVNCAVFRNESETLKSSWLIEKAVELARVRWPEERFYTYVNGKKIKSTNPGYCYLQAGWQKCGITKGGLTILELLPHTLAVN